MDEDATAAEDSKSVLRKMIAGELKHSAGHQECVRLLLSLPTYVITYQLV